MVYQITYKGRTRLMASEGPLRFPGTMSDLWVRPYKYKYEHKLMPPSLSKINGKTYIMPIWKEVVNGTTLNDIEWVKPQIKKTEVETFEFASASSGSLYTTKRFTKPDGEVKFSCTCPGVWRAKDRRCKHIKSLEE